jgi:hypothetical protein
MPYIRNDDQYQTVLNLNWMKGEHNLRFGTDIYYQGLNHTQPELSAGDNFGARGGFRFRGGPTQLPGGPSGNSFNAWGAFLLGLPDQLGRLNETVAPYTTRMQSYSFYARDQWQVNSWMTISAWSPLRAFPVPTRSDRGLERYNPDTNMMEVGGVGSVPRDLEFQPRRGRSRRGLARPTARSSSLVIRGGFGITNDPYLARPADENELSGSGKPVVQAPNASFGWRARLLTVCRRSQLRPRKRHHSDRGNVTAITIPKTSTAVTSGPFNGAVQKQQVGLWARRHVGTGALIDQLGFLELNWSPIGGGQSAGAGTRNSDAPRKRALSRRLATRNTTLPGAAGSLRFANGIQLGSATLSKSTGIAGSPDSDGAPRIMIPEFYSLNTSISPFDRTHNLNITNVTELPFGPGKPWLKDGVARGDPGRMAGEQPDQLLSGLPLGHTASGTSLNAPESSQRADQVKDDVETWEGSGGERLLRSARIQTRDRGTVWDGPGSAVRGPACELGFWVVPRDSHAAQQRSCRSGSRRSTCSTRRTSTTRRQRLEPAAEPRRYRAQSGMGSPEVTSAYGERQMRGSALRLVEA